VTREAAQHRLIGIFPAPMAALAAVRELETKGIEADRIDVVRDPDVATEIVVRTFAREGLLAGAFVGAVVALAWLLAGHPGADVPWSYLAVLGFVGGVAFIGRLAGQKIVRPLPDTPILRRAAEEGQTIVAVRCGADCGVARHTLRQNGATHIADEALT
jgi:hypothetical protein